MDMISATDVRKNWSVTLDSVVRERPTYVKRTHDNVAIIGIATLNSILAGYKYRAKKMIEKDGSVTLSLIDIDIVVNDRDEVTAKQRLAEDIKEYAEEFYEEFPLWSNAPNRKNHVPYVIKALTLTNEDIVEDIVCQSGKKSSKNNCG